MNEVWRRFSGAVLPLIFGGIAVAQKRSIQNRSAQAAGGLPGRKQPIPDDPIASATSGVR